MKIAGVIYSEQRRKQQERYQTAVNRASFLSGKERKHWALLGHILTTQQLREAEHLIIDEDLKRLKMKKQLDRLRPNKEK